MAKRAQVSAVAMDPNHKVPVVLLKIEDEDRFIPIWVGLLEASAILVVIEGAEVPRPMTHDLLCNLLATVGAEVTRVEVTDLRDGTYFAELTVLTGEASTVIDARPSDALAVALRTDSEIWVNERVLDKVQVDAAGEVEAAPDGSEATGVPAVEEAVRPTPGVSEGAPMDDDEMRELLEKLDPDDFKYKM